DLLAEPCQGDDRAVRCQLHDLACELVGDVGLCDQDDLLGTYEIEPADARASLSQPHFVSEEPALGDSTEARGLPLVREDVMLSLVPGLAFCDLSEPALQLLPTCELLSCSVGGVLSGALQCHSHVLCQLH